MHNDKKMNQYDSQFLFHCSYFNSLLFGLWKWMKYAEVRKWENAMMTVFFREKKAKKRKIWIRIISETQNNVKLSIRRSIEWRPGKEKKMSHQARQKTEQGRRGRKLEQKVLGEITNTNKREVVDTNLKPQESASPTITKVQGILFPLSFFCFGWGMEKKRNKQNDDKARR